MKKWQLILMLLLLAGAINFFRPIPPALPVSDLQQPTVTKAVEFSWPTAKQAAVGAVGYGLLEATNTNKPLPMASTAKLVTALAIDKHQSESYSPATLPDEFNSKDVDIYQSYIAKNGSVAPVREGQLIYTGDALTAMLLPSANNVADSFVIHEFGSMKAYVRYANAMLAEMGADNTHVADASGFSPKSVSTAQDLLVIGEKMLAKRYLSDIVKQPRADLRGFGTVYSTNTALGTNGIDGIKTGHTDQSGGCYIYSATKHIDGQKVRLIGAVMGAPDIAAAIQSAPAMIDQQVNNIEKLTIATKTQVVGHYEIPWSSDIPLVTAKKLEISTWPGKKINVGINSPPYKTQVDDNSAVGSIFAEVNDRDFTVPIKLQRDLPGPSFFWRLTRI